MVRVDKYRGADGLEWFIDQPYCTDLLIKTERFAGPVLDPCCGMGQILMAFQRAGWSPDDDLMGRDLVDRCSGNPLAWRGPWEQADFLAETRPAFNIVMNPPYCGGELTEKFIRHALTLARHKVAILANHKLLGGEERFRTFWRELPPSTIYWLANRPTMPPGDKWLKGEIERISGGEYEYVWLVYCRNAHGFIKRPTEFRWLHGDRKRLRRLTQPAGPLIHRMETD